MPVTLTNYAALDWATFSVDATTAKTLNSATASGNALNAVTAGTPRKALVSCPAANLRFSVAGAIVTASTGHRLLAGSILEVDVNLGAFNFIAEVAGPSTVFVDFLGY